MKTITQRGITMTQLTLGTVQLGVAYGIANKQGKPDESKSHALLQRSEELGIRSFDTAAGYGDSEVVLGHYFKDKANADRLIVTKFKLQPDIESNEVVLEKALREQLEQSLDRLGLPKIPIYLMHSPEDLHRHGKHLAKIMLRLVNENLIGIAGVSVYHGNDLDVMLQHDVFKATQIPINIFDQRLIRSGHLQRLKAADITVFARSVFLQGLFFMDPDQLPPNLAQAAPFLRSLHELAEQEGMSIAQMALSFVRDLPEITSLVIGAEAIEQIEENVRLIEGPALSTNGQNTAKELFRDVPELLINPSLWHNNAYFKQDKKK